MHASSIVALVLAAGCAALPHIASRGTVELAPGNDLVVLEKPSFPAVASPWKRSQEVEFVDKVVSEDDVENLYRRDGALANTVNLGLADVEKTQLDRRDGALANAVNLALADVEKVKFDRRDGALANTANLALADVEKTQISRRITPELKNAIDTPTVASATSTADEEVWSAAPIASGVAVKKPFQGSTIKHAGMGALP